MKRLITMVLALMIALCGFAALGEGNAANEVNCLIEEGSFIIQIDDPEGDLGWVADDMSQDPSVVTLYDADLIEDTFVVRYDPAGDGVMTVGVRHYIGITCDKAYTFDLHVENGAVTEITGGSHKASPDETEQDPYLSGEWLEQEIQYTSLSIKKNPTRGWVVEAASPLTHGAYIFKATIYYDCERDSFVYDKGKFWDVPITESNEESDLGEAKIAGATGSFTLGGESIENATLTWHNDENGEDIVFARTNDAVTDAPDWTYYTFEGTGVAIKLSGDFAVTVEEPTDGTIFQAINGDVLLQVLPVEGKFDDLDALMEFYNGQEYVIRATQLAFNGVDLVYAEGGDDEAMVYALVKTDGSAYAFVFIPQTEDGPYWIEQIISTICPSDSISE